MRSTFSFGAAAVLALLGGCGDDDGEGTGAVPVEISFAGEVGGEAFACGQAYDGLGTTGTTLTPNDFRFYVHDVRLVTAGGEEIPVTLEQDGVWQHEGVALLDFEDASSGCDLGTPETNATVRGEVPAGDYAGLRFRMGLPFELNHADPPTAPAPLNLTSMWWNWLGGYKFIRFDSRTTGSTDGWFLHLGSTMCDNGGAGPTAPATQCANRNVVDVDLAGFDPDGDVVVADVAPVLADANLDESDDVAIGCMSAPTDMDCVTVFPKLGLPFMGSAAGEQLLFTAR